MAEGFGVIVTQGLNCYWMEDDGNGSISHSILIEQRMKIKDNEELLARRFVRIQVPNYDIRNFEFDERSTLPGWAEGAEEDIKDKVYKILSKVKPIYDKYYETVNKLRVEIRKTRRKGDYELYGPQLESAYREKVMMARRKQIDAYGNIQGFLPPDEVAQPETD